MQVHLYVVLQFQQQGKFLVTHNYLTLPINRPYANFNGNTPTSSIRAPPLIPEMSKPKSSVRVSFPAKNY